MLLPEPLTPATTQKTPSGNSHVNRFEVIAASASDLDRALFSGSSGSGERDLAAAGEEVAGDGALAVGNLVGSTGVHEAASRFTRAWTDIHEPVGGTHHGRVVLDDDDRVSRVSQPFQAAEETVDVLRVQADRGLIQNIKRVDQSRPECSGDGDSASFAAGERSSQAVERQVVEPDLSEQLKPMSDLLEHAASDGALVVDGQPIQVLSGLADAARGKRGNSFVRPIRQQGLPGEAGRPSQVGTGPIAPPAAQEDADMHLVSLALKVLEEASEAGEAVISFHQPAHFLIAKQLEGPVDRYACEWGFGEQFLPPVAVAGRAPGGDRALSQRLRGIGHDLFEVEIDRATEALAGRAGARGLLYRKS